MTDVTLSTLAEQDLIYVYSYQQFGEAQAEHYTRDLHARFQLLADFPGIGLLARVGQTLCLQFPTGAHVIYYRRTAEGVHIGRVRTLPRSPIGKASKTDDLFLSLSSVDFSQHLHQVAIPDRDRDIGAAAP